MGRKCTQFFLILGTLLSVCLPNLVNAALTDIASGENVQIDNSFGSADDRKELQQLLKDKGYYSSSIDGNLGSGSRAAINAYKADNQLTQNTVWNEAFKTRVLGLPNRPAAPAVETTVTSEKPETPSPEVVQEISPVAVEAPAPSPETEPANRPAKFHISLLIDKFRTFEEQLKRFATTDDLTDLNKGIKDQQLTLKDLETNLDTLQLIVTDVGEKNWNMVYMIIPLAIGVLGAAWAYFHRIDDKVKEQVSSAIDNYLGQFGDLEDSIKSKFIKTEDGLTVQLQTLENQMTTNKAGITDIETSMTRFRSELELSDAGVKTKNVELHEHISKLKTDVESAENRIKSIQHQIEATEIRMRSSNESLEGKVEKSYEIAQNCESKIESLRRILQQV